MTESNKQIEEWLLENSQFIKVKVGSKYDCIFRSMRFDPTGGYRNGATIKYKLEDLKDNQVREFSSSSKSLANKMMKLKDGDRITLSGALDEQERKTYNLVVHNDESSKKEIKEEEIPIINEDEVSEEEKKIDPSKIPF